MKPVFLHPCPFLTDSMSRSDSGPGNWCPTVLSLGLHTSFYGLTLKSCCESKQPLHVLIKKSGKVMFIHSSKYVSGLFKFWLWNIITISPHPEEWTDTNALCGCHFLEALHNDIGQITHKWLCRWSGRSARQNVRCRLPNERFREQLNDSWYFTSACRVPTFLGRSWM